MAEATTSTTNTMAQNSASDTHASSGDTKTAEVIEKLLGTNELLENILVRLPMKRLLLAQRVCKHWKALIDGSLRLQRALFMVPVPIPGGVLRLRNGCEFRGKRSPLSLKMQD